MLFSHSSSTFTVSPISQAPPGSGMLSGVFAGRDQTQQPLCLGARHIGRPRRPALASGQFAYWQVLCRAEMACRDGTGWLGQKDSNSQMSLPKLVFEVWPEFPFISERSAIRDFSRLSCQAVTCTAVQSKMNMVRCGQAMLERRPLRIREFESSHPTSQCGLHYAFSACVRTIW